MFVVASARCERIPTAPRSGGVSSRELGSVGRGARPVVRGRRGGVGDRPSPSRPRRRPPARPGSSRGPTRPPGRRTATARRRPARTARPQLVEHLVAPRPVRLDRRTELVGVRAGARRTRAAPPGGAAPAGRAARPATPAPTARPRRQPVDLRRPGAVAHHAALGDQPRGGQPLDLPVDLAHRRGRPEEAQVVGPLLQLVARQLARRTTAVRAACSRSGSAPAAVSGRRTRRQPMFPTGRRTRPEATGDPRAWISPVRSGCDVGTVQEVESAG